MLDVETHERSSPPGSGTRPDADPSSAMLSSLLLISKTTRAFYGFKLAALGFHNGQDEVLVAIGAKSVPVSVLADQLSVRPSTVSKMLDRLIQKGLCERASDRQDARRTLVRITPAGTEARKRIVLLRQEVEAELVRQLDAEQQRDMSRALSDCAVHLALQLRRVR